MYEVMKITPAIQRAVMEGRVLVSLFFINLDSFRPSEGPFECGQLADGAEGRDAST